MPARSISFNPMQVVLGFLDEYNGRRIEENSDRVELFYESERAKARVFAHFLAQAAALRGLEASIRIETGAGGRCILHSRELADLINSHYSYTLREGFLRAPLDDHGLPDYEAAEPLRTAEAFVRKEMFETSSDEDKLSYLAGAHARYGSGPGTIRYYNAGHKAELTKSLLLELGCRDVEIEIMRNIPHVHTVTFQPSDRVREAFSAFEALAAAIPDSA